MPSSPIEVLLQLAGMFFTNPRHLQIKLSNLLLFLFFPFSSICEVSTYYISGFPICNISYPPPNTHTSALIEVIAAVIISSIFFFFLNRRCCSLFPTMNGNRLALLISLAAFVVVTASFYRLTGGKSTSDSLSLSAAILCVVTGAVSFQWLAAACPAVSLYYPKRAALLTLVAVSRLIPFENVALSFSSSCTLIMSVIRYTRCFMFPLMIFSFFQFPFSTNAPRFIVSQCVASIHIQAINGFDSI